MPTIHEDGVCAQASWGGDWVSNCEVTNHGLLLLPTVINYSLCPFLSVFLARNKMYSTLTKYIQESINIYGNK